MNLYNQEEENINITEKYYNFLKQLSEDYLKYLMNYKTATGEYLRKLALNQEKYRPKLLEITDQIKDININHIMALSSIIPKVLEQQIINIEFFLKGIDEKIENFEKYIKEQSLIYNDYQLPFKDIKNELIKKYKEIEKLKTNFMTNITFVEENIHKFYIKQNNKNKKASSKLNLTELDANHELNLEQINSYIQKAKKTEEEYIIDITLVKNVEKNYIDIAEKTKVKSKKVICQLANGLKELISDCMVLLRNSFKLPLGEIDTYLNEIVTLDEYSKCDEIIQSSFQTNNELKPLNPEKYILKFFQQKNSNVGNSGNKKIYNLLTNKKVNVLEDGLQEMDFVQEEEIFMTIKKMMENFTLLEKSKFNLKLEEEKLRCKYLTLKILSFAPKSKLYSNNVPNITPEEVEEIDEMLKKKQNRIIFMQKISQFRTRGIFEIPEDIYNILSRLFNKIVKTVEIDEDYDSAVNIIILSQTYYIIQNNKKVYLQNAIMNNDLFKGEKFWDTFINYVINKEIALSKETDEKIGVTNENNKENEEKYSNIAFAQLVPMINNMIEFELDINIIEEIVMPLIEKYKISPELSEVIFAPINEKKKELEELKNKNNMIKEASSGLNNNDFLKQNDKNHENE